MIFLFFVPKKKGDKEKKKTWNLQKGNVKKNKNFCKKNFHSKIFLQLSWTERWYKSFKMKKKFWERLNNILSFFLRIKKKYLFFKETFFFSKFFIFFVFLEKKKNYHFFFIKKTFLMIDDIYKQKDKRMSTLQNLNISILQKGKMSWFSCIFFNWRIMFLKKFFPFFASEKSYFLFFVFFAKNKKKYNSNFQKRQSSEKRRNKKKEKIVKNVSILSKNKKIWNFDKIET